MKQKLTTCVEKRIYSMTVFNVVNNRIDAILSFGKTLLYHFVHNFRALFSFTVICYGVKFPQKFCDANHAKQIVYVGNKKMCTTVCTVRVIPSNRVISSTFSHRTFFSTKFHEGTLYFFSGSKFIKKVV